MINAGPMPVRETGLTIDSTVRTFEAPQSEYAAQHTFIVDISTVDSLSDGELRVQMFDPLANNWVDAPQEVHVLASGGGTPSVINGNTSSATAVTGGRAVNTTGITAIDNTIKAIFTAPGLGLKTRLYTNASSGSGTFGYAYVGRLAFPR